MNLRQLPALVVYIGFLVCNPPLGIAFIYGLWCLLWAVSLRYRDDVKDDGAYEEGLQPLNRYLVEKAKMDYYGR